MAQGWSIERRDGAAILRCHALGVPGVGHAFGSRDHDVGPATSGGEAHRRARAELAAMGGCGTDPGPPLIQVHGARVVRASEVGDQGIEADAQWERTAALGERCVGVRTADCVPILLASTNGEAVAAVHAGWRGTAAGIVAATVEALASAGHTAERLVAALGPAIGPCCYEVSSEVAERVALGSRLGVAELSRRDRGALFVDLHEANRRQLIDAGVSPGGIHRAPWCTACEADLFFSYRRDGGLAGRQFNLIGPAAARP